MKDNSRLSYLLIALVGALIYLPFLGSVHLFDWDEINFAECAREMITSKNYGIVQIGYLPFWEKPPLFIWMQAASMNFFGVNEFAARLPNAICGITTLLSIFHIGRRIYDMRFAYLWTFLYAGSLLPTLYFHTGIIDPWFNLFIFLGLFQFILYSNEFPSPSTQKTFDRKIIFGALFMGLAVLTKGPVALLVFGLCFMVWRIIKRAPVMSWKHFILFSIVAASIPGIWFIYLFTQGKGGLVMDFILYQVRLFRTEDAGHGGGFFYHWYILLLGCFPASIFAIQALLKRANDTPFEAHTLKWMRIIFWVVLILFSIVKTKIIHYSSLCYFPLTYLGAYSLMKIINGDLQVRKWMKFLYVMILIGISAAFIILSFIDKFKEDLTDAAYIHDQFAVGNLQVNAHWIGIEWIVGLLLLMSGILFFVFMNKGLNRKISLIFLGSTLICFTAFLSLFIPRIEEYSQKTAIDYWVAHNCPDFYLETLGYKSYAHYYYGNQEDHIAHNPFYKEFREKNKQRFVDPARTASELEIMIRRQWMLEGHIDYPAYFICKNTYESEVRRYYPQLRYTGSKNGFVFWERVP